MQARRSHTPLCFFFKTKGFLVRVLGPGISARKHINIPQMRTWRERECRTAPGKQVGAAVLACLGFAMSEFKANPEVCA